MLSDLRTLVAGMERDASGLIDDPTRDAAIALAVLQYDKDRPRVLVKDLVTADGAQLDTPAEWVTGFSLVQAIEHPLTELPPPELGAGCWRLYAAPSGRKILFTPKLAAGATVRVRFSVPHAVDADTDTVPPHHREAVAAWAAAHLMDALAAARAGDREPTLHVDGASPTAGDVSRTYAARAKELRVRYAAGIGGVGAGTGESTQPAASATATVSLTPTHTGGRLFRRRGWA